MTSKIVSRIAYYIFQSIQYVGAVFITVITLPPTLFYVCLPATLISTVAPVFSLWYQWAYMMAWMLKVKTTWVLHDERVAAELSRNTREFSLVCIVPWNGPMCLWATLLSMGPAPFLLDKRTLELVHPIIRCFLVRLGRFVEIREHGRSKCKTLLILPPHAIKAYLKEYLPCIRRRKMSIIFMQSVYQRHENHCIFYISKRIAAEEGSTSLLLVEQFNNELLFCKILDYV